MSASRAAEATWTAEEALAWARSKSANGGKWPGRRFRVEGSRAGTSRLLGKKSAERTQAKYGGNLVELIPTATAAGEPKKTINQSRAEDLPACPTCKVDARFACRSPKGESREPHASRQRLAALILEAKPLPACGKCDAPAGELCRGPNGETKEPHSVRKRDAARQAAQPSIGGTA